MAHEAIAELRTSLRASSDRLDDAAQITARAVDTSWQELRKLIREALLLAILLALVMLGLPFAAGYVVGRRREQ